MKPTGSKTLIFDAETSKTLYGLYAQKKPQYASHKDIVQDWFVLCAAWKWRGLKTVHSASLASFSERYHKDHTDDYELIKKIHSLFAEADAVVGHNIDKFDWAKFLERVICHRLPPIDKPKMI